MVDSSANLTFHLLRLCWKKLQSAATSHPAPGCKLTPGFKLTPALHSHLAHTEKQTRKCIELQETKSGRLFCLPVVSSGFDFEGFQFFADDATQNNPFNYLAHITKILKITTESYFSIRDLSGFWHQVLIRCILVCILNVPPVPIVHCKVMCN